MTIIRKDPADVFDVQANYAAQMALDSNTIASSEWRIPGSLDELDDPVDGWLQISNVHAATNDDTTATVWVEGGTAGSMYDVINTVTTAADRTWERTIKVRVWDL
jgi:hypothetical protein